MANKVSFIIIAQDMYSKVANKISRSTKKMSAELTGLKARLGSVNSGFTSFKNSLRSVGTRLHATAKKIGDVGRKVRNVGLGMVASLTLPIAFMMKSFKDAARDAEEIESKFATIFRQLPVQSDKVAKALANDYGMAITKSKELLGNTGDLLTGFGFTTESALDLSNQVNQLAVDLASFTNFSGGAEGASAALTKALLGERESVKSLGISILEKDVQTKISQLVSQGMQFETMRQAKAIATLQIAMEQSKNAIGDFARTNQSLANQERITSARMQDLREQLGKILLPLFLKFNKVVQVLIDKFLQLSPKTQKIVLGVAALVAVIGPLLLIVGAVMVSLPILTAGFAALGTAITTVIWPLSLLIGAFIVGWKIGKKLSSLLQEYPAIWNAVGASVYGVMHPVEGIKMLWQSLLGLMDPLRDKLQQYPAIWNGIGASIYAVLHPIESVKNGFNKIVEFAGKLKTALAEFHGGILDKVISLFGGKSFGADISAESRSVSDVNIGISAPPGVVKEMKKSTTGKSRNMNIGVNMKEALS